MVELGFVRDTDYIWDSWEEEGGDTENARGDTADYIRLLETAVTVVANRHVGRTIRVDIEYKSQVKKLSKQTRSTTLNVELGPH